MESNLLFAGQAGHRYAGQLALDEGFGRVVEVSAVEILLAPAPGSVEDNRMQIHPSAGCRDELHVHRPPIGFDGVAAPLQDLQCRFFVQTVHREVQVAVRSSL